MVLSKEATLDNIPPLAPVPSAVYVAIAIALLDHVRTKTFEAVFAGHVDSMQHLSTYQQKPSLLTASRPRLIGHRSLFDLVPDCIIVGRAELAVQLH